MINVEEIPNINSNIRLLDNRYQILYTIGQGRYAKVKLGIDKESGKRVAIKIMRENVANEEGGLETFISEVKILSLVLPHHNIVQLLRVCLNGKYVKCDGREFPVIYYVMKIAENGELFKFLMHTPKFEENLARFFFVQLTQSLEYLHSEGIAHKDIKPENILIDQNMNLKLCDFGFSEFFRDENGNLKLFDPSEPAGSPEYNPPEVTQYCYAGIKYSAEAMDVFASACVLFIMAMSSAPFASSKSTDRYYSRLCSENKSSFWKIFAYNHKPTNEFKDLIQRMLELDSQKRLTLQQIKEHPWMKGPIPSVEEVKEEMKERIKIVQEKTLEELKQKSQKKGQLMKQKAMPQEIGAYEQLKLKYNQEVEEINKTLIRKSQLLQKKSKQQSNTKQAQPDDKESEPQPIEECFIKKEKDEKLAKEKETTNNSCCKGYTSLKVNKKKEQKLNIETCNSFEEHKQEEWFEERRGDQQMKEVSQLDAKDVLRQDIQDKKSINQQKKNSSP